MTNVSLNQGKNDKKVIAERLKEIAMDNNMKLKDFSDRLGVQYRTLMRYTAGELEPSATVLRGLTDIFDISASWLLAGVGPKYLRDDVFPHTENHDQSFVLIPRYDVAASAGHGSMVNDEPSVGHYAFNKDWLRKRGLNPKNLSVISVRGNSMEPDLYNGDLILLNQDETTLEEGNIYAMRFSDGLFVKRVQHFPQGIIRLLSRNPHYHAVEITNPQPENLNVIGRVVASMHEW